jgi:hypothetical protein
MKKISKQFPVGILVLLIIAIVTWLVVSRLDRQVEQVGEVQSPTQQRLYVHHTEHVYKNTKYGFQFVLPPRWKEYYVREEQWPSEGVDIHFALPVQSTEVIQDLSDPEKTERVKDIWQMFIYTPAEWEKEQKACIGGESYCFVPIKIAASKNFVFTSGQFFIAGGWDPCDQDGVPEKEPYFCTVYRDMMDSKKYSIDKSFSLLK